MKTSWEKMEGRRTDYIDVHYNEVVVGYHYGTGMSDNGGACSHQEFLKGEFQGLILERFGQEILDEVINAVKNTHQNPDHNQKRAKIKRIKDYIEAIPIDNSMNMLLKHPDTIDGFNTYGNRGGYNSYIESDDTYLTYQSTQAILKSKHTDKKIKLNFDFHISACVELHDYYYLIGNDNFHVLSSEGKIIFTTEAVTFDEIIFGYEVRINRVFRNGELIFFSYWAFDSENIPSGLIRYKLGKGLIARDNLVD